MANLCNDCGSHCHTHNECLKNQEFNIIVENAHAVAKLKKYIKDTVPEFKGKTSWLKDNEIHKYFEERSCVDIEDHAYLCYRFMTLTFDPKKFSFNELTQPELLDNYIKNCLWNLRFLFKEKSMLIVREYHKSGIPHYHMMYKCESTLEHATILLRFRYYLSATLRNRSCVHDRQANEYAKNYITKSATSYWIFKDGFNVPKKDTVLELGIIKL